jgi:hypothetical protein
MMGKDGADQASRRRAVDARSEGGEIEDEHVELGSGPRVVRRAVKLRFGGIGAPRPSPAPEPAAAERPPPRPARHSSHPPAELEIELRSIPPQRGGLRLRRPASLRPRRAGSSIAPNAAASLWPGVLLLVASIALGFVGQSLDFTLGPVRPAWIAAALMLAGIGLLVYRLWPRDR